MIITVCNEKGGTGKSAIAQNLAVWLALENHEVDVLLVDADPQETTVDWIKERQSSPLIKIPCIQLKDVISQDLIDQHEKYHVVIVDCGGAASREMNSALVVSDLAIIPFRPKRRDLKRAQSMSETLDQCLAKNPDLTVCSLITQAPTHPNQRYRVENAKELLSMLNLNPLDNFTRNLNAWDDADESGSSVLEYADGDKAADDARAVFIEIIEAMQ